MGDNCGRQKAPLRCAPPRVRILYIPVWHAADLAIHSGPWLLRREITSQRVIEAWQCCEGSCWG